MNLPNGDKLTWHFKAPNVHDFMWAADPAYTHDILKMENGVDLHFFYKKTLEEKYGISAEVIDARSMVPFNFEKVVESVLIEWMLVESPS